MSGIIRYVSVLGAVAIAVACVGACGGGSSGDVVAQVGGYPITGTAFDHWLSVMAGDQMASGSSTQGRPALRQQVLGFLISSQWTIGEATEMGVRVSDEEAREQLERFKFVQFEKIAYERFPHEAALKRSLARKGETPSDQLWLMKLSMLATRLEQARLSEAQRQITHTQIVRYYDENRQRFVLPEQRDVEVIATFSEAVAEKAKREVWSGKSFLSVVKRLSIYPNDPGGLPRWQEEEMFHKHIFAAKLHALTGPVHQALYYVFEVTKVTPPVRQTLAQSEASIRQRLAAQQQRQTTTMLVKAFERKWIARTSCRSGYVVPGCRQYTGVVSVASSSPYFETNSAPVTASTGVVVSTKQVKIGRILGAGPRMLTVYMFEADRGSTSACYGACARVWLPVRSTLPPVGGGMAIPADPGMTTRADGTKQVTYFHHPLYYYVKDKNSGDVYGQGVKSFGSRWYALSPIGGKFDKFSGEVTPGA